MVVKLPYFGDEKTGKENKNEGYKDILFQFSFHNLKFGRKNIIFFSTL